MPQNHDPPRLKLTSATLARQAEIQRLRPVVEKLIDAELSRKTEELKDRLVIGDAAVNQS